MSGRVRAVDAAFPLDDLARRSCYSGLQPGVTKRIGTAARRKALVILQLSCFAGLQLEVAKRVVTAHNVVFQHSAAFRCADLQVEVAKCNVPDARRELCCRSHIRGTLEAFQSSEEVAQQRSSSLTPSLLPPLTHSLTHAPRSLAHSFIHSAPLHSTPPHAPHPTPLRYPPLPSRPLYSTPLHSTHPSLHPVVHL